MDIFLLKKKITVPTFPDMVIFGKKISGKILTACVAGVAAIAIVVVIAATSGPVIKLEGLTSGKTEKIRISKINPVNIDDTLLVPARDVFCKAGVTVEWDESRRSVKMTLPAGGVETPVEKKAAELLYKYKNTFREKSEINAVIVYVPVDECKIVVFYNYKDTKDKNINVEKTYESNVSAKINEDGTAYVPLRAVAERFGLSVDWHEDGNLRLYIEGEDEDEAVEAMAEKSYTSSEELDDIVGIEKPTAQTDAEVYKTGKTGKYIGQFKITHYCTCTICNGSWGSKTAYGGAIRPGVTIAVDPSVIKKLSWVYIDGYGLRLAEDVGGAINGYHIDMAVADHETAMAMGVTYRDVWYASSPE